MADKFDNNDVAKIQLEMQRKQYQEHLEHLAKKKPTFVVQKVEPIWEGTAVRSINEPLYDFDYLSIQKLWTKYGIKGQGVNVYVIDSGIDPTHPAFVGHKALRAMSFLTDNSCPLDGNGHGTWVCGKIAAAGVGIAPKCSLTSIRTLDANGSGTGCDSTKALEWVLEQPDAHLVNMSLGSFQSSPEQEKVLKRLAAAGVLVVAAAGNANTNTPFYPASYDCLLAVSAFDRNETRASFSNYGGYVDISAPGVSCYGTYLQGAFRKMSGTSMATPIVTGLLALGMSLLKIKRPQMSRVDLRNTAMQTLLNTAKDLGVKGRDEQYGFGGLNALSFFEALEKA